MSVQLLDKTRKINKLLHNNNSSKVVFNDICDVLKEILESNILVISKKGKVLGTGVLQGVEEINELIVDEVGGFIDPLLNERLLGILSTKENVNLETLGFVDDVKKYTAIITPIDIAGERLGTLFVYRENRQYDIDDIILSEYGTTVVGLEMMRSVNEENAEETRKVQIVKSAISTLSFSELEAITHIFDEMDGKEGILVASKIADRVGITRSVIVNALRKFESAGVIESRSSGMKGTYIKVLNDVVFDELDKIKKRLVKKTTLERELRTDVRTVKSLLPETLHYDPLHYIDLSKGLFIGMDRENEPMYIPLKDWQKQHADIIGTTGAGKGVAAGILLYQSIIAGEGVFVMDPKDDEWAPHLYRKACEDAGKPFALIDLRKQQYQLNLIEEITADELAFSSSPDESGNSDNLQALINISTEPLEIEGLGSVTVGEACSSIISNIGIYSQQNQTEAEAAANVYSEAQNQQSSVSGVSMDEEAVNLITYQQIYEANLKVISTGADIFDSVLEMCS